jgi:7,8-dihydropterin-6-yl-methyl-4-(beta-D-ribofuranosyl)aminobenzene 5'-phosphate synthase
MNSILSLAYRALSNGRWMRVGPGALVLLLFLVFATFSSGLEPSELNNEAALSPEQVKITVLYDNRPDVEGFRFGWGFACLVETPFDTLLMDASGDSDALEKNLRLSGIDSTRIRTVVISHAHKDHYGGLGTLLRHTTRVSCFVPVGASWLIKETANKNVRLTEVEDSAIVSQGVSYHVFCGGSITEGALAISTKNGIVIITGCAHPGIVRIVESIGKKSDEKILFAMGGFHLSNSSSRSIARIARTLKDDGIEYIAPCHCSGKKAIEIFHKEFKEKMLSIGSGSVIKLDRLANQSLSSGH